MAFDLFIESDEMENTDHPMTPWVSYQCQRYPFYPEEREE